MKTPHLSRPTTDEPNPPRKPWNEDYEQRFIRQLEQELDKVFNFQNVKSHDITRRIEASDKEVYDAINRQQQANTNSDVEPPSDEDYLLLEEDLSDVIADVHDLAKFTQLNYTGFQKIIKKHDVRTQKAFWNASRRG